MSMSKQPASPPPGDRPVNSAPPPPPSWRFWLWPLALLATIVLYIFLPAIHAPAPVNLNFSQFQSQAAAQKVTTAEFGNSSNGSNTTVTGKLKNGKVYDNRYAWLIQIKDGKIWQIREYMDTAFIQTIVD